MSHSIPPLPPDADLRSLVRFSTDDGLIWLSGQRMLLMHSASLMELRKELMNTLGPGHTRRVLMRGGYAAGERDALLARQIRPNGSLFEMFAVGPQLHRLEGAVRATPLVFDVDEEAGRLRCEVRWEHSWEAESQVREWGPQSEPACWMLLGYASGYSSAFFRKQVLFKELQCEACGHSHCLIEGRFVHEWPDGEQLARDYLPDSMLVRLDELQSQVEALRTRLQPQDAQGPLLGQSRAFQSAVELLRKAAPTQVTVLLTGETGVGKERFASALHAMSPRADKPFVAVNCAALPDELIESELFGAEKGAFTGANATRIGRFERANGGTLMLDELGEMPLPAQAKLLRVLQTGEIERLGGAKPIKVDVRVVAATNVDLEKAVEQGRFRADLLYRLNVYPIRIPALRERVDDIESLAMHLLQKFSALHGTRVAGLTDRAIAALRSHRWPGNVRELENLMERGLILSSADELIDVTALFPQWSDAGQSSVNAQGFLCSDEQTSTQSEKKAGATDFYDAMLNQGLTLDGLEDRLLQESVRRAGGNLAAAARALGMTRPQLSYRLSRTRDRTPQQKRE
ncbi:sigma 54-interacting transcriptional regulator [Diaphorobacter sp. HDW4A]|uniref:sigma-54-dependent Fis family transcriptional regulator n=1 Tax=Diaphorobacter sp. HDW4A TaxID=2714924 RepID=UPI00140CEBCC|nr:sigma-54-dependent Fis family transcriptional regulator [Diaphorobacter sp. HDW4A]QIL78790.1 sigma 54-interacting transcriptional regulator [Diaphorobacter sp. HDW4A]